jgi:hypothetical protein
MSSSVSAPVAGAVFTTSAPRPTPTPAKVPFKEIMSRGLAATSQVAMNVIPGAPLMAFALRGGSSASVPAVSSNPLGGANVAPGAGSAEGPSPSGTATGGSNGQGGLEGAMAQSQEMNLYYLQVQEQVNAQNRSFTTISNVMKAEHETVKTAIGNIR